MAEQGELDTPITGPDLSDQDLACEDIQYFERAGASVCGSIKSSSRVVANIRRKRESRRIGLQKQKPPQWQQTQLHAVVDCKELDQDCC